MMDILNYISTWSIFKWVTLVLIAGFIGQFGKMMAEAIIVKIRRRRELRKTADRSPGDVQQTGAHQNQDMPGPSVLTPPKEPAESSFTSTETPDKKMLKALAKARKKELKKT